MILGVTIGEADVHHDVRAGFVGLLRAALRGHPVIVAHGPIYDEDPAAEVLAPFVRSARESGWPFNDLVLPRWVRDSARERRAAPVVKELWEGRMDEARVSDLVHWTRAGLVLELAGRWGVPRAGGLRTHVRWRLRGTVTGRFGVEAGSFNPMTIPEDRRSDVVASPDFVLATFDFNAFDLRSMVSMIPDMWSWYEEAEDYHQRTADIMDIPRDEAKGELFVHAYGGRSRHHDRFKARMPYLDEVREMEPHGAGAREVQSTSARAFRAALSAALPLLVSEDLRPLFTVHDELTVEVRRGRERLLVDLATALEAGAAQTIGVPYRVKSRTGPTYADTKG